MFPIKMNHHLANINYHKTIYFKVKHHKNGHKKLSDTDHFLHSTLYFLLNYTYFFHENY